VKVFRELAEVPDGFGPSAVTIGKFDGVHSGHRAVIRRLREVAAEKGLTSFDRALADLSPEDFVRRILVDRLHAAAVLVGSDFRFGARGAGDVAMLRELGETYGFVVHLIDDVRPEAGRRVSSTWIRELLAEGDVAHAASLLGHIPTLRGVVVHGAKRGRELGFPTANLSPDSEGLIPADGVYAGWLTDGGERYPAAISVGNNPTFEGVPQKQVEAYVLDRELDLYDHHVEISFVERIRGMVAYSGIDPLIAQIADDVTQARRILAVEPA
jgi:riboflavin kinase/FMN adenylyltransferase